MSVPGVASNPSTLTLPFQLLLSSNATAVAAARRDARNLREILLEASEQRGRLRRRVAVAVRRDREDRERIGAKAEVDARDVGQALREPPGEHEQRHRQRDLRRRERRAKTRRGLAARLPRALRLLRGIRLDAR